MKYYQKKLKNFNPGIKNNIIDDIRLKGTFFKLLKKPSIC